MSPSRAPTGLFFALICSLSLSALLLSPRTALAQTVPPETSLLDPQYYNIAPCPCNLQPSACDIGCCCDADCSDSDKSLFNCIQGFYGGNTTVELYRRCSSTDRDNPDYHPFTCVLIEDYNAYLGLYYPVQTAAQDSSSFDTKKASASAASRQFPSDTLVGLSEASLDTVKLGGLTVLQVPNRTVTYRLDNRQLANYRLAMPRRTLSGGCDHTAGVLYLNDATAACDLTITADLCQANAASPLDSAIYATDCSPTIACENFIGTRSSIDAISSGSAAALPVSVTYLALSTAGGYQKGVTGRGTESAATRQSPSVAGSTCNNAVVEVQYSFVWSGSTLVSLSATVYLAPVAIGSVVTQRYSTAFVHLSSSVAAKRSGVVGYEPGAELLGGARLSGGGSGIEVNTSSAYQPRLWKSNSQGGCQTAGEPVLFQLDATSYCTEQVLLTEFADCAVLRERLRAKLRGQFAADAIGIFGSANASSRGDWVTVLEQELLIYTGDNFTDAANSTPAWINLTGVCLGLPTEIVLTVLYAEQGKTNGSSIWQVVGAYLRYKQVHLSAVCGLADCNATSLAMSTGVQFVRVPSDWADNTQAYLGPAKVPCWWGICWDELAYPLTTDFEGESRAMSMAWCVFIALIGVYAFCISRPWW